MAFAVSELLIFRDIKHLNIVFVKIYFYWKDCKSELSQVKDMSYF